MTQHGICKFSHLKSKNSSRSPLPFLRSGENSHDRRDPLTKSGPTMPDLFILAIQSASPLLSTNPSRQKTHQSLHLLHPRQTHRRQVESSSSPASSTAPVSHYQMGKPITTATPSCPVAGRNGIRSCQICKCQSQMGSNQAQSQPSIQPSMLDLHPADHGRLICNRRCHTLLHQSAKSLLSFDLSCP